MEVVADATLVTVAAVLCATAALPSRVIRVTSQVAIVVGVMLATLAVGDEVIDVALRGALLAVIAAVGTAYSSEFRRSGAAERAARQAAERRTELLEAVRALPELDLRGAAQVATAALRAFGSVAAGVVVVRDGRLVPIDLSGVPPIDRLLRVGEGVSGRAVAEGRTLVFSDHQELPERFDHLQGLRSSISTPIRVGDEVVGAVMAAQARAGPPSEGQIEVIEVLAAHLGAVIATRRQLDNRGTLLRRMDRLDAMRTAFVDEVSDELRDPLTIIRGAGHTIRRHVDRLSPEDRHHLLTRLCGQADRLRAIVDALLDFSRVQASHRQHREPVLEPVGLRQLFQTLGGRVRLEASAPLDVEVAIDIDLVRHAVELLVGDAVAEVAPVVSEDSVTLAFHFEEQNRPALVNSLVAQLAVEVGGAMRYVDVPTLVLPRADRSSQAAT